MVGKKLRTSRYRKHWGDVAPSTVTDRERVRQKCGAKCFLRPSTNGFPICTVYSCRPDCRGIESAKYRASQFKYDDVLNKINSRFGKLCIGTFSRGSRRRSKSRKKRASRRSKKRRSRRSRKNVKNRVRNR